MDTYDYAISPKFREVREPIMALTCGLTVRLGCLSWQRQRERDRGTDQVEGLSLGAGGLGGYSLYQIDVSDYDAILTSEGIAHSTETPQYMAHRWDSGWMPIALAALYQDSINLH